ncbi:hypothetical protein BJX62DRAFT_200375 [Aspergillus germanicus]
MPVIPDPSTFAQGSNNDSSKSQEQNKKATAQDHISKGPQIPDSERSGCRICLHS